jgi:hypothetical protein
MFQQPNGSDTPGDAAAPAVGLPDPNPGVIPVRMPPAPGHAVVEGLGTGTPIGPLSPALLRSVAPSGMLPPPRDVAAVDVTAADPGTDDKPDNTGNPVPAEPQPLDIAGLVEFAVTPPPLNMLLGLAGLGLAGLGLAGAVPVVVMPGQVIVLSIGPSGAGLSPPAKSSVEPSGIPEPPTGDVRSIAPSGDVVPAPGAGEAPRKLICATPGPVPSNASVAAMASTRPMETSVLCPAAHRRRETLHRKIAPALFVRNCCRLREVAAM